MGLKRQLHPDLLEALKGPFHPVSLVFVDWPGDPVRVHSGVGTITWAGHDWAGIARLGGGVSLPSEGLGIAMIEGGLTLGGLDEQIDEYLAGAEDARGRMVQIWFGAVTERAGTTLIGEPFPMFSGTQGAFSDQEEWDDDSALRSITAQLVSGPSQRANASMFHTYDDQRRHDPEDTAGRWAIAALAQTTASLPRW